MAVLTATKIPSAHWYTRDGRPAHRQPLASGDGERATTIADARRLHLLPSVTSILGIMAKPQLDEWKQTQVAMAALRNPKQEAESEDYWCKRVKAAAFESVEEAAELGSRIHAALDAMFDGVPIDPELFPYVGPVADWIDRTRIKVTTREQILVNLQDGFAGTSDAFFTWGNEEGTGILDYKTRKTIPGKPVTAYDGQAMQLAAYAASRYGEAALPSVLAANVYISTTEPGRIEVIKHADLFQHWCAFRCAAHLWRYTKGYDPRSLT